MDINMQSTYVYILFALNVYKTQQNAQLKWT